MKNILIFLFLSVLVFSPVVVPSSVSAATPSDTQKDLLIQLLLEKVKALQVELQALLKVKDQPVKIEIIQQNSEYKKEVAPLLILLETKNKSRKELLNRISEKECTKPSRTISKGVEKFYCRNTEFKFSATTTSFIITKDLSVANLVKAYGLSSDNIYIIPEVYDSNVYKYDSPVLVSPQKALIPPSKDLVDLTKQLSVLDNEILDLKTKIESLKTKYGI